MNATHAIRRPAVTAAILLLLALTGCPPGEQDTPIEPAFRSVLDTMEPNERIDFVITLDGKLDLEACRELGPTKAERVPTCVEKLKEIARERLAIKNDAGVSLLQMVDSAEAAGASEGCDVLWLPMELACRNTTRASIEECAQHPAVGSIRGRTTSVDSPASPVEVGSLDSWAQERIGLFSREDALTGSGAVLGVVAAGVDGTNPYLQGRQLRRPDSTAVWFDASGPSGRDGGEPVDYRGEGTRMATAAVGDTVGIARHANWSACNVWNESRIENEDLLQCLQMLIDPLCHDSLDPSCTADPSLAADVVLLGISGPARCSLDRDLAYSFQAMRAMNVLPVAGAGSNLFSVGEGLLPWPANYPEVLSVGATDRNDEVLESTRFGTAGCGSSPGLSPTARPGPQILAPGLEVLSTLSNGNFGYIREGEHHEGMAAALVAGTATLFYGMDFVEGRTVPIPLENIEYAIAEASDAIRPDTPGILDIVETVRFDDSQITRFGPPGCANDDDDHEACLANPPVLTTRQRYPSTVTFKNLGVTPWTRDTHYLTSLGSSEWRFLNDQPVEDFDGAPCGEPLPATQNDLDLSRLVVEPGEEVSFQVDLGAPNAVNSYFYQVQMARSGVEPNEALFGSATPSLHVPVEGEDCARYVGQGFAIPGEFVGNGVRREFNITFRNTGSNAWPIATTGSYRDHRVDAEYALLPRYGAPGDTPFDRFFIDEGDLAIPLHSDVIRDRQNPDGSVRTHVYPDETVTFVVTTVVYGEVPRTYGLGFAMGRFDPENANLSPWEGPHLEFWKQIGGGRGPLSLHTIGQRDGARLIARCGVPGTIYGCHETHNTHSSPYVFEPGELFSMWVEFRNTGNVPWPRGTCLEYSVPNQNMFSGRRVCTTAEVAPNRHHVFAIAQPTPNRPGHWRLTYRVKKPDGSQLYDSNPWVGDNGDPDVAFKIFAGPIDPVDSWRVPSGVYNTQDAGGWSYLYYNKTRDQWDPMQWSSIDVSRYPTVVPLPNGHWIRNAGQIAPGWMSTRSQSAVSMRWQSNVGRISSLTTPMRLKLKFDVSDIHYSCNGGTGNGVRFKIRHKSSNIVNQVIPPGGSLHVDETLSNVRPGDLVRFILKPIDGNTRCDETWVRPRIFVYPDVPLGFPLDAIPGTPPSVDSDFEPLNG